MTRGGGAAAVLWLVLVVLCQSLTQGAHTHLRRRPTVHQRARCAIDRVRRCVIMFRVPIPSYDIVTRRRTAFCMRILVLIARRSLDKQRLPREGGEFPPLACQ